MTIHHRRNYLFALVALLLASSFSVVRAQDPCADGLRPVEHTRGVSCVPQNPQRVVALEWTYAEDLLALGVQPVGVADLDIYPDWVKIPVALDASVVDVGGRSEPNLEVIAGLQPDLILAVNFRVVENYDELSAIAPTLVFNPYPDDFSSQYAEMMTTFSTIAQVMNREAEGEAVLDQMNDVFADAKSALEAAGRGGEGFILSQSFIVSDAPTFRLFTGNSMAVEILEQLGLTNDWDDATPQLYGFSTVDMEAFNGVGDTNFIYIAQDEHNDLLNESPLWNSLPWVKSGRSYWLGGDAWLFGGPLSAEVVVNAVLDAMDVPLPTPETA